MKTLKALLSVAAGLVLTLSSSTALAGHYLDIDDHAREIESEAGRADLIVRQNLRGIPLSLYGCLRDLLGDIGSTACELRDVTRRDGNLRLVKAGVEKLDASYCDLKTHMAELREWTYSRRGSLHDRHRHHDHVSARVDDYYLRKLCERVDEIGEELDRMKSDLRKLLACEGPHHARPGFGRPSVPVIPSVPPVPAPSRFDRSFHGRPDRSAVAVPIFSHKGTSFAIRINLD